MNIHKTHTHSRCAVTLTPIHDSLHNKNKTATRARSRCDVQNENSLCGKTHVACKILENKINLSKCVLLLQKIKAMRENFGNRRQKQTFIYCVCLYKMHWSKPTIEQYYTQWRPSLSRVRCKNGNTLLSPITDCAKGKINHLFSNKKLFHFQPPLLIHLKPALRIAEDTIF